MTDSWSEQQLQHFRRVRDGFIKTGFSKDVAEAHARRTVEQRRARGERPRTSEDPTKDELYLQAKRFNITGRSKMDKEELARAVAGYRSEHADE